MRTLSLECRARWRTSPTTPLIRSELSWRVPMVSRMGVSTYLRMIRKAAATRKMPTTRVIALVIREMTYTRVSRPLASPASWLTASDRASISASAALLQLATSPLAVA